MMTRFNRRAFFGALSGVAAALPSVADGQTAGPQWDFGWFDQLKGKHKQVFDAGAFELNGDDSVLRLPNNYLNTFRDALHVEPPDINVAVGIARTAFPINASDALWEKYKLGATWKINGTDGKPATRNIFLGDAGEPRPNVRSLMARGVVFWQCNIALGGIAFQLSRESGVPFDKLRAELIDGLNPGVKVVPSHSMTVGLAQERGFTYMKV